MVTVEKETGTGTEMVAGKGDDSVMYDMMTCWYFIFDSTVLSSIYLSAASSSHFFNAYTTCHILCNPLLHSMCSHMRISHPVLHQHTLHDTTCVTVRREDSREGDDVLALDSLNAMPGGMSHVSPQKRFRTMLSVLEYFFRIE